MKTEFSKVQIVESLKTALESQSQILAAWLGGSTATGFEDTLSDTDIVAICEDPNLVFAEIEKVARRFGPLSHIWHVEETPWKGFSQKFFVLEESPPTYFIDAGVFSSLNPVDYREWLNTERHGQPVILFDKNNILKDAGKSPHVEIPKKINWPQFLARFEILYRTFTKECERGKLIDSFTFYQRLITMWIQLQRNLKTPQKHDFGLRYIYRDFPKEDSDLIEKYIKASDLQSMQAQALDIYHRIYLCYENMKA